MATCTIKPATVEPLMCRHLLSVDWQGYVYDCDFNQMLGLPLAASGRKQLWEIDRSQLKDAPICGRQTLLWMYGGGR